MKKFVSTLLVLMLLFASATVFSASAASKVKPNTYTLSTDGAVVLQDSVDRAISPQGEYTRHAVIPGISPTTGLPWAGGLYLPMLVQISNPDSSVKYNGKEVKAAGVGHQSPWGGQYADIVYEGVLTRDGNTRITFLFSDSFADGLPTSAGPIRSARNGHVLLREEWESGIVFMGGPRRTENSIEKLFAATGSDQKGVIMDLTSARYNDYKNRVDGLRGPNNLNADIIALRNIIPSTYESTPRPFLFTDESPYTGDSYPLAYSIGLDWGRKTTISHFYYDDMNNLYLRYSVDAPYMTSPSQDNRAEENREQMSFSNVIIQRVPYEYFNNRKDMPDMQSVGQGNADIFIGGRYIAGYWIRSGMTDPTVFYDDQGNELQLTPGKTFIAHLPPESRLTYRGME